MYEGKEVEAHGRREAAEHHAGEDEGVLVSLVVRGEVVQVEHPHGEQRRVRTQGDVGHGQGRYYLVGGDTGRCRPWSGTILSGGGRYRVM